tara:strand:+ start:3206 stop:4072 length:867 start_codon:yes stop_codon:yes gene_type:complete
MSSTTVSYADVIKDIDDFYVENCVEAYAPTLDKKLKFKPLSVSQMKRFIELQVKAQKEQSEGLPSVDIVKDLNQCLVDNYIGKDSSALLQKLTILDRDCIVAQLRANNNPVIDVATEDGKDTFEVSIEHILTGFKDHKLESSSKRREKVLKFKSGQIKLKLKLPTLLHDSSINDYFKAQITPILKQGKKAVEKKLEKILSQTFFVELSKYIELLEITKKDNNTIITFDNTQTLSKQLALLEELPTSIIVEINSFIKDIKEYKDGVLFYVDQNGNQKPIVVDVNLFTTI